MRCWPRWTEATFHLRSALFRGIATGTDAGTAGLFKTRPDRLSLCVHGSDHTNKEFGVQDWSMQHLLAGNGHGQDEEARANDRTSLRSRDGFPKMEASRNTPSSPCEATGTSLPSIQRSPRWTPPAPPTVRDWLEIPLMVYDDFPLFARRYPKDIELFALDLLFGKPALLVEHHAYFMHGVEEAGNMARQLNNLEPSLQWRNLTEICQHAYLQRRSGPDTTHVKFYTRTVEITNASTQARTYILQKQETDPTVVGCVTADGSKVPFSIEQGVLKTTIQIEPRSTAKLMVMYRPTPPPPSLRNPVRFPEGSKSDAAAMPVSFETASSPETRARSRRPAPWVGGSISGTKSSNVCYRRDSHRCRWFDAHRKYVDSIL